MCKDDYFCILNIAFTEKTLIFAVKKNKIQLTTNKSNEKD